MESWEACRKDFWAAHFFDMVVSLERHTDADGETFYDSAHAELCQKSAWSVQEGVWKVCTPWI